MELTPGACPTNDERVRLFALLLDTNARLARSFGALLETSCELPLAWFEVLMQLRTASEGCLKMSELANAIVHSSGGTTRLIDRLVAANLVERHDSPDDRRAIHVAITEAGNAKLDEALEVHLEYLEAHVAQRLNCDERSALTQLLTKLNEAV
jgi:DNA-binding MarR family transcriptional regulator